jgi:hypothetical protein
MGTNEFSTRKECVNLIRTALVQIRADFGNRRSRVVEIPETGTAT